MIGIALDYGVLETLRCSWAGFTPCRARLLQAGGISAAESIERNSLVKA